MERLLKKLFQNQTFTAFIGLLGLYFIYRIIEILALLLIAFILVIALRPLVLRLQKTGLPYKLAVPIVVLVTVTSLIGLGTVVVNGLAGQIDTFSGTLESAIEQLPIINDLSTNLTLESVTERLSGSTNSILAKVTSTIISFFVALLTVVVITIYWLLDYNKVKTYLLRNFTNQQKARRTFRDIERSFGSYIRGQFIIMFIIGLLSYIVYLIIGLPGALALAVIAGLLEVIPTLGPIIAAIPAILIGFTVSPQIAVITLIANLVIQQLENQLIAPKIFQHTINLHPIAVIVILFVGNLLFGLEGVLLAVPFALLVISIKKGYYGGN